jgi:uncharacterized membrane protein
MSEGSHGTVAPRRRSVPLIISLCLNVALIAMVAVGIANGIRHARHGREFLSPQILMAAASPAERARIQSIVDAHADKVRALKKADAAARLAALKQFESPQFDRAEFAKAIDAVHKADDALRQELTDVTEESVLQLSPAERQAVAAKAKRRMEWWRFLRGHHNG